MNVPADPQGLERLLRWCDPSNTLQRRVADCAQRAGRCRELNERNGALVTARLKKVEGLLEVLTGRTNQPKVYGRQGMFQAPGANARVLASV
jgi:flagellar biosynthesis protein FlgN